MSKSNNVSIYFQQITAMKISVKRLSKGIFTFVFWWSRY